jgi:acetyl esterase/lipase
MLQEAGRERNMMTGHFRTALFAGLAAAALAGPAPASAAGREFPVAAAPVLDDRLANPAIDFPQGVKAWRDIVYKTVPGYRPLILDLYKPATPGPHPLIVYIHGGGWFAGHTRHNGALADFPGVLAALAAEGFTVASVEYRLSDEARFPAQLQDVTAAIRFLRANADQYAIDPARVGVWGGSAGGHLTALASLACRATEIDPEAKDDGCVQAAVTWYGVFDFAALKSAAPENPPEKRLLGCTGPCPADKIRAVSPVSYIDAKDPPFLLIHGEADKVVPVAQSHLGEAALKKAGVPVSAIYIPNVDHSFIGTTPEATRAATLQALNATFDFFEARLGGKRP